MVAPFGQIDSELGTVGRIAFYFELSCTQKRQSCSFEKPDFGMQNKEITSISALHYFRDGKIKILNRLNVKPVASYGLAIELF